MAWYDKFIGGTTGGLLSSIGSAAAQQKAISDIEKAGERDVRTVYGDLPPEAASGGLMGEIGRQSQFKPFGVTTATGSRAGFSSTGNLDTSISPTEQALQERMLGFGSRAFGFLDDPAAREQEQGELIRMLTQDPTQRGSREQAIMDNLTALQAPEQETRSRLGLLGDLGLQSIPAAYQGQNQLLATLSPALQASQIGAGLQSTGLGIGAGLAESTLEAQLGYSALANALRQQQFQGLFDLLKGEQAAAAAPSSEGATISINPQTGRPELGGALGNIGDVLKQSQVSFPFG